MRISNGGETRAVFGSKLCEVNGMSVAYEKTQTKGKKNEKDEPEA